MRHSITVQGARDLAFALRSARQDASLTQADVAGQLGTNQQAISQMENETRRPTLAVRRLLEHLRASGAVVRIEWDDDAPRG